MLAEASPEFAFITVSKAMIAEEKTSPRRKIVVIGATIIGFIASCFIILFLHHFFPTRLVKFNPKNN